MVPLTIISKIGCVLSFLCLFCSPGVCRNLTRFITSSNYHGTINHDLDWIFTSNFLKACMTIPNDGSVSFRELLHQICLSIVWITMTMINIFSWHSIDWKEKCLELFWENGGRLHDVLATLGFLTHKTRSSSGRIDVTKNASICNPEFFNRSIGVSQNERPPNSISCRIVQVHTVFRWDF